MTPTEADGLLLSAVFDDDVRQDPVVVYRQLIESMPRWKSGFGMTVLATYHDSLEYLRNPRWGRPEADMELPPGLSGADAATERTSTMLFLNPPDHTRIRGLVARAFTPRRVDELRPKIDAMLAPILDSVSSDEPIEIMANLAIPFPVAVISALLGVEDDQPPEFLGLIRDLTSFIDAAADAAARERAGEAAIAIAEFFVALVERKRTTPDDGLLSALIEVEAEGDRLNLEELIANTILLYAAGFETTSNLIGNGLWALLRNPDQLELLRSDRSLLGSAVMEILRYDSPVQLNVRTALTGDDLFGERVERGAQVLILQGSANHDPAVYDRPEQFDVTRFAADGVPAPLSFGWGPHHCLGAHLARAEGELILEALLDRFDRIELAGEPPRYRPSFTLRGLESLELRLDASSR